jgi:hypothetical protein
MGSHFVVCRFHLYIDYVRGGFMRWYSREAEMAVFHFGEQVSDVDVYRRMGRIGFKPANLWCYVAAFQAREAFPIVASGTLIAPGVEIVRRMSPAKWRWQAWHRFLGVKWLGKAQKYKYPFRAQFAFSKNFEEFDNRELIV